MGRSVHQMLFDTSLLNTQQYKVRIKGKSGAIQGKGVAPFPTPRCSTLMKREPSGCQLFLLYMHEEELAFDNLQGLICRKTQLINYWNSTRVRTNDYYQIELVGYTRGGMVKAMDSGIVVRASSYSSRAITFTFGQIPLGKAWTPLILPAMG